MPASGKSHSTYGHSYVAKHTTKGPVDLFSDIVYEGS